MYAVAIDAATVAGADFVAVDVDVAVAEVAAENAGERQ